MNQYQEMLRHVLDFGMPAEDRTGTGTYKVFGYQFRHNLHYGFPLLTTKKLFFRGIVEELLWILSGSTNVRPLQEKGIKIWDQWANEDGSLGPVYGEQWRLWTDPHKAHIVMSGTENNTSVKVNHGTVDQISELMVNLKKDPLSRRHVISAWNVADIPHMKLAPCHCLFQFNVRRCLDSMTHHLDVQLYQRSGDIFLGVPFNIASYSLLLEMVVATLNATRKGNEPYWKAGEFIHTFGDLHLYKNHWEQACEQLTRSPTKLPKLTITPRESIFDYTFEDFTLEGYNPQSAIKAPVAV